MKRRRVRSGGKDVGYCRPPKASQFKKGQSGNCKGRPKRPLSMSSGGVFRKVANEKITVVENGMPISITRLEACLRQIQNMALRNDTSAGASAISVSHSICGAAPDGNLIFFGS
jgi:Family of unknown function (DUF5681)